MQTIIDTYRDIVVQIATPYSLGTGFYLSEHDLIVTNEHVIRGCLLYTSPSPRDGLLSRMPSSA